MNLLFQKRREFFQKIAKNAGPTFGTQQIVITHFLPDRPELLEALDQISPIALLVAIPYSITSDVLDELKKRYNVATPSLAQLRDEQYMLDLIASLLESNPTVRFVFNEMGGYIAPLLNRLHTQFGSQIAGCVEGGQSGHMQYEKMRPLPYPVISTARSTLKEGDDTVMGPSCYYSADRLVGALGILLVQRRALVVGYGRVGRGVAFCLQENGCTALVYDTNPIRNYVAHGDGMFIPDRLEALKNCDIIFGCTGVTSVGGDDFDLLADGCFLVSCSSQDIEFDLQTLHTQFHQENILPNVDRFTSKKTKKKLYLLAGGTPINLLEGAYFGPELTLAQGELITALKQVFTEKTIGELAELANDQRKEIAENWMTIFIDPTTGAQLC